VRRGEAPHQPLLIAGRTGALSASVPREQTKVRSERDRQRPVPRARGRVDENEAKLATDRWLEKNGPLLRATVPHNRFFR
jgi:hypothetical protein